MKVFITGSSSHLANVLLPLLCDDPKIELVTGLDIRQSGFQHPKFRSHIRSIDDSGLQALIVGHDAYIHMAYVVLRGKMSEARMRHTNVDACINAFQAAAEAGVQRFINLSSAAVYGNGTDLLESAPFRPLENFLYAQHKVEVERRLKKIVPQIVEFRPHVILGPQAQALLKQLLSMPFYISYPDPQPLLQAVHEEDVARAIQLALHCDAQGAFNLAPDDSMSFREMISLRHRFKLGISEKLAGQFVNVAWRLTGWGGETAWLSGGRESLTCSNVRAKELLAWQPRFNTAQAVKSISI